MRATWYITEDGTAVDPSEVTRDEGGALVHKTGKIAIGDHGNYRTTGVDIDEQTGKPLFGGKGDHDDNGSAGGAAEARADMKPEDPPAGKPRKGYKTRETKAD